MVAAPGLSLSGMSPEEPLIHRPSAAPRKKSILHRFVNRLADPHHGAPRRPSGLTAAPPDGTLRFLLYQFPDTE